MAKPPSTDGNSNSAPSGSMKYLLGVLLLLVVAAEAASSAVSLTRQLTRREFELERQLADLIMSHRLHHEHHNEDAAPAAKELEQMLKMTAKFQVGDIVEMIYNEYTTKNRVVYPFRVEEIHEVSKEQDCATDVTLNDNSDGIQYTLIRLVDGRRLEKLPEATLRQYLPYEQNTRPHAN